MPLVIHTYRTACKSVAQPPGFGDFLRGTIALHQFSEKYNFDLQVDFSRHPLSEYIKSYNSSLGSENDEVHEFFNKEMAKLDPFLSTLDKAAKVFVTTHCLPIIAINDECRKYIGKRLLPNKAVAEQLAAVLTELGPSRYCTVHLRMGDHTFGADIACAAVVEDYFRNIIVPEWGGRILVLSDNNAVKEQLSARFGVMTTLNVPVHLGQCGTVESPEKGVLDSYLDFLLMARSKKIYQYSVYPWGSGFSDMCAHIYSIPLVKISSLQAAAS